jgi:hypothetical protein
MAIAIGVLFILSRWHVLGDPEAVHRSAAALCVLLKAQTVEAFANRLREELDLDALSAELLVVVDQTMQPTRASPGRRGLSREQSHEHRGFRSRPVADAVGAPVRLQGPISRPGTARLMQVSSGTAGYSGSDLWVSTVAHANIREHHRKRAWLAGVALCHDLWRPGDSLGPIRGWLGNGPLRQRLGRRSAFRFVRGDRGGNRRPLGGFCGCLSGFGRPVEPLEVSSSDIGALGHDPVAEADLAGALSLLPDLEASRAAVSDVEPVRWAFRREEHVVVITKPGHRGEIGLFPCFRGS